MNEFVYNLFAYVEGLTVTALGAVVHELSGTDAEKLSALQFFVEQDYETAKRLRVKTNLEWQTFQAMMRLGRVLEIFEQLLRDLSAPINPLVVITPILDGSPHFYAVTDLTALHLDKLEGVSIEEPGSMIDYLKHYELNGHFDLPRLIDDDFFSAIRLLFNARHYVSTAKLLMSCIDTVAFIDSGDSQNVFHAWLDKYALLASLGITAAELYEFRNGLLHMTNLSSRKVASKKIPRLIFYVDGKILPLSSRADGTKYFNLRNFIDVVAEAMSRWMASYNDNPAKWIDFVKRYDLIVSDSRVAYISIPDGVF